MRFARICLLVFIVLVVVIAAAMPGLYDTRRMATAVSRYHDTPTDVARQEIEDARAADRAEMYVFQGISGIVVVASAALFMRLGRTIRERSAEPQL